MSALPYRSADAFRAAQRGFENAYDSQRDADEAREEAIEGLLSESLWRQSHTSEADDWVDGTFDGEHYSAVERALANLAAVPVDELLGSDALATVLRLADVHAAARDAQLRILAEREVDDARGAA